MSRSLCRTMVSAILTAAAVVVSAPVAAQSSGPSSPPPAGDISVTNSPNAVTGQTVNVGTIVYQEARKDPVTRKLVSSLRSYTQMMIQRAQETEEQAVYVFSLDDGGSDSRSTGDYYFILVANAEDEELGERIAHCDVEDGATVFGYVASASVDAAGAKWKMRMMTREYAPLVQRICRGLRMPVSSLMGTGARARGDATVYDYLSRGEGVLGFALMSDRMMGQDLETSFFRSYWTGALALRYYRPPSRDALATPEVYDQVDNFTRGDWIEGKLPGLPGNVNPASYPPQARQEFGKRLDRLDADWTDYLKGAAITIRGQRKAVIQNGRPARILPRFKLSEVGSPQFWQSATDMMAAMQQTNCLAQYFLVEKEYVAPEDVAFIERCGLDEVRLPGR